MLAKNALELTGCSALAAYVFWPGFAGADFTIFMQQAVACHPEDRQISAVVQLAYERRARSLVPLAFGWFWNAL